MSRGTPADVYCTDDLRDRIAAAIYNNSDEYSRKLMVRPDCPGASEMDGKGKPVCYLWADAVIEALGLREERTETETVTNEQGATWFRQGGYRYVTDWIDKVQNG